MKKGLYFIDAFEYEYLIDKISEFKKKNCLKLLLFTKLYIQIKNKNSN